MSLLEDLYSGDLVPAKNFGENSFSGYLALKQSAEQREKELLPDLTEEQLRLYKRIRNDRSDMNNLELERMFIYAFKMGIEFMREICSE